MIYSHARCDNCEAILVPEGDREFVDEDYARWQRLSVQERKRRVEQERLERQKLKDTAYGHY